MLLAEKLLVVALVIGTFLFVWRLESRWRIVVSPFLLAMYFELLRVFPAFLLADRYLELNDSFALWTAFLAFLSMMLAFGLVYCWPTAKPGRVLRFSARKTALEITSLDSVATAILAVILIGIGTVYFGGVPAAAQSLFSLVTSGGDEALARLVGEERLALTKGAYFGGEYRGQGLMSGLQQVGWTMLCVFALLRYLKFRSAVSAATLALVIVGAWIFVAGSGARAPFLNIVICLFAAYSLVHPVGPKGLLVAASGAILAAIVLGLYSPKMFFLLASSDSIGQFVSQALVAIAERIFIGNGINDVYAIEFVRNHTLDLQLGAVHARDFLTAIPGVQSGRPLSYTLYTLIDPTGTSTTFRSATYLADVFVDFHLAGVVAIYMAIGAVLALFQKLFFSIRPNAWSLAVAVTLMFYIVNVLQGGPIAVASSLVIIVGLYLLHRLIHALLSRFTTVRALTGGMPAAAGSGPSA